MIGRYCRLWLVLLGCVMFTSVASAQATPLALSERTDVHAFIQYMVKKHHFKESYLKRILDEVRLKPDVIARIKKPAESFPWNRYAKIFLTPERVKLGAKFWKEHAATLERAERTYGVPASMIVAIIGIESFYGKRQGTYRVVDSLATLAFNYPPRSAFFRKELEQFLVMTREQKMDPFVPRGSYAGAIGQPQFMPSSFRAYAVDFDGDGHKDLNRSVDDVIGSVANYFKQHGWQVGQPVATAANVEGQAYQGLKFHFEPHYKLATLEKFGVKPGQHVADLAASIIKLSDKPTPEVWLGFHNFYVITRYNHSMLYAMAAHQLQRRIAEAHTTLLDGVSSSA